MNEVTDWGYYPLGVFAVVSVFYAIVIAIVLLRVGAQRFAEIRGALTNIYLVTAVFAVGFSFVWVAAMALSR